MLITAWLAVLIPGQGTESQTVSESFVFEQSDIALFEQTGLLDKRFEEQGLVLHDSALEAFLERVGEAVVPDQPLERVTWRFRALRDSSENAFALPNGSIYVHAGLLALLEREDQLASVLAHEAVHVVRRHGYLANRDYRKKATAVNILSMAGNMARSRGSAAGAIVWGVLGGVVPSILVATIDGYSRELESEADTLGFQALVGAGYDPASMVETFERLQLEFDVQVPRHFYNDHPKLADRIAASDRLAAAAHAPASSDEVSAQRITAYEDATLPASRLTVTLDLGAGRLRTAVVHAERLAARGMSAEHATLVGDAYRALGPLTPKATAAELTTDARKQADKDAVKYTPEERERQLLATPAGQEAWQANVRQAESSYQQALSVEPEYAPAYRGLGLLCEKAGRTQDALAHYRRYLEIAPQAQDAGRVKGRIERLAGTTTG